MYGLILYNIRIIQRICISIRETKCVYIKDVTKIKSRLLMSYAVYVYYWNCRVEYVPVMNDESLKLSTESN